MSSASPKVSVSYSPVHRRARQHRRRIVGVFEPHHQRRIDRVGPVGDPHRDLVVPVGVRIVRRLEVLRRPERQLTARRQRKLRPIRPTVRSRRNRPGKGLRSRVLIGRRKRRDRRRVLSHHNWRYRRHHRRRVVVVHHHRSRPRRSVHRVARARRHRRRYRARILHRLVVLGRHAQHRAGRARRERHRGGRRPAHRRVALRYRHRHRQLGFRRARARQRERRRRAFAHRRRRRRNRNHGSAAVAFVTWALANAAAVLPAVSFIGFAPATVGTM